MGVSSTPVHFSTKLSSQPATGQAVIRDVDELIRQPGVGLVMPSEEREDFMGGLMYSGEADRFRTSPEPAGPSAHEVWTTTYGRVFANDVAAPYMKDERLRFPVGSVIVREKLLAAGDATPELVSVMIKRPRGFRPVDHDWEFAIVDRGLLRVRRGKDVQTCAACHANTRSTDMVYKTYLKPR